jgi:NADH-quinone oxidoreductase subunit C
VSDEKKQTVDQEQTSGKNGEIATPEAKNETQSAKVTGSTAANGVNSTENPAAEKMDAKAQTSATEKSKAAAAEVPATAAAPEKPVTPEKPAAPKAATAAPAAKPAAAKKEEPSPEVIAKTEAAQKVLDLVKGKIVAQFGDDVLEETMLKKYQPTLVIKREHWREVVNFLRLEPSLSFDYPEAFAGTDYPAQGYIEVVVYLYSMKTGLFITVKTRTPRDHAEVPSLVPVYAGANWEEREIYDLLGVKFTDHPDLRRIMLPDDFKGHPLRKDYSVWDE